MGRSSLYEKPANHREAPKDYRIDNIDKINTKIKQILDCLHEGEKPKREEKNVENSQLRTPITNEGTNYGRSSRKPEPKTNLTKFEIKHSSSVYQEKKNI